MQEDALWVKKTLEGDEQAFHRLIMKYYTAIYALITSWVKNSEDAKDLTQEVFLKAYQELDSLRHPEQFRLWLRQIARNQCQDWLRKKQETFVQLDEDMIYETPSADELLILQETLAKVMKAIDELPKSESQLLKERYLDDASYDDLEAKHGLSHSVLAMRLLRARQHVREKIKLLPGVLALSWQDAARKMLIGGTGAMKITVKVKIIAIGVAVVLVLGGTGVVIWHTHQSAQETQNSAISQTGQQTNLSISQKPSIVKVVANKKANKPIDTHKEDARESQNTAQIDLLKDGNSQETKISKTKVGETIDPKEETKAGEFTLADMAARMPVLREEIRTGMARINTRGDELTAVHQSGNLTPETIKWLNEQQRELNKEWKDLFFNKIGPYYAYKLNLEGRQPYPLAKGGEFYELAQRLPPHVFPREFDNPNAFSHIWLGDD